MQRRYVVLAALLLTLGSPSLAADANTRRTVIKLDIPSPRSEDETAGGIVVADVNDDDKPDFLVTVPGHIAAYGNDGEKLWIRKIDLNVTVQSERNGLPGHHGPGVAAGDVNGEGKTEVVFVSRDGAVHALAGATGETLARFKPPTPDGARPWQVAIIADFSAKKGDDDRDILLQTTNRDGYLMGRYLAAYRFSDGGRTPLWTADDFVSCAHNSARVADLDGDRRDEVLGATVLGPDGKLLAKASPFRGHMDSVFVADVRPDIPGLEVVLLEEGSDQTQVLSIHESVRGAVWRAHHREQEPQNAAVGRFKPGSDEVFIWCRTRYNRHQKPFVLDARGKMVFEYEMDKVKPDDWTTSGVEVIHTIDWTGSPVQLACAKERHTRGDVCIFEPLTGKFVARFTEQADRLYVADVFGDWREEVIVLNGNELHVYQNLAANPRPDRERLWRDRNYRRLKQAHNYYSP